MIGNRIAVLFAATCVAVSSGTPSRALCQGDSIRIDRRLLDAAVRQGLTLRFDAFFSWIEKITVINMIPREQSTETVRDAETNLAVMPGNTSRMVGTAFTPNPTGSLTTAPVYVSTDGGNRWALRNIVPSANGSTGDISVDFATRGGTLYTGILKGGLGLRMSLLRTSDPFTGGTMTTLTDDSLRALDQPFASAITTTVGGSDVDRVYFGFNAFDQRSTAGGNGRTASSEFSLDARTAAAPAGFAAQVIEARNTAQQDMPPIRHAVHSSGVLYGIFYRWASGNTPSAVCDVIVVRDNNFASGATPFTSVNDPSDAVAGRIVVSGRTVPAFPASLGLNRLVASNVAIAVHPTNAGHVWIAWADSDATSFYTLHVRRSTDSAATWSANDLLTIPNATNPALAVNSNGVVAFLYQRLTGTAPNRRWATHVQRTTSGTSWSDLILANTPDSFLGDYLDLISVGRNFYGTFPAWNRPDMANFPQGVKYQRTANFTTNVLRDTLNTVNVNESVDPFFFKIESLRVFDICLLTRLCTEPVLEPGRLIIPVDTLTPVRVSDPIPKNCLVKWNCPGCEGGLCPGFYHIFLDDIDPAVWNVEIVGRTGETLPQQQQRVGNGIVVSFRPRRDNYRPRDIGDYYLTLESTRPMPKGRYTFGTRVERSPYPQSEHLRRRGAGGNAKK
ncbi:MAG TPA: sialidase family protein [Gemmatimonadaceae bacterium]|jgi:hypothetical protein|nr:sialidase family protein [Gemmatimonadaceae bacterium]